ncbi:EcsC protein family [Achromobacter xylosoxidans]|uniref:EcsC family protein n=1 Tax=Alcaligenes xylosoxydans xylosoxydans TaxID=85698 RepID=UPI0006C443D9|nr:EcsC family protein [Achromobacter xylosoxidans]CUI84521.1 EcsC protein family [Achromobacter xylosoxidans]CUJ97553.1 EcsC protein family [Achromobacter xylosoxidans]
MAIDIGYWQCAASYRRWKDLQPHAKLVVVPHKAITSSSRADIQGLRRFDALPANAWSVFQTSGQWRSLTVAAWQNTKAATSGFVTGLGGIITLPVAIPANIASVLFVQVRMIAAIAHLGGYDVKNDKVKTLVYACLVANSAKDILKDVGVAVGNKLALNAVKAMSGKTLAEINKRVGFKLFTKFGEKGIINLGKAVPLLGGLIGGSFDAYTTNTIGNVARDTFTPK